MLRLGWEGSLLDPNPPCWKKPCRGRVVFYASISERPCLTMKGVMGRHHHQSALEAAFKDLKNRR
jgi:hypothetical protein